MRDEPKTKAELLQEVETLRRRVAELEHAKDALRESQHWQRAILDSIPDIAWLKDKEGIYIAANEPLCRAFGIKFEDFVGKTDFDISPEDLAKRYRADDEKVMKSGKRKRIEEPWGKKKGKRIWIETIKTPIHNDRGEVIGTSGIARDITERKKAEQALKQYQFMVESAHDVIFFKDLNSRYIIANNKTLEALGLPREQVIGKNDYEIMPKKEEARKNIEDDKLVFKTGKPTEITKHMTGSDGKERWFQAIKVPQFDDKGNVIGLIGIARDITEHKKAEEELKESEERFRTIFDNAPDGLLVADAESKKIYTGNKMMCQVLGYEPEEIKSLGVVDIHPQEDLPYVIDQFERQLKREFSLTRDIPVKRKDGSIFYADISALPITLARKTYLLGIFRDITERKKAEEALKESEEKYRDIVEKEKDIIYTLDEKGNITFASPAVETILGYRPEEVIGKHFIVLIPKEWHEKTEADFNNLLKEGEITAETVLLDKQGQAHFVEYASTIIKEGNKVTGTRGIVRDITERKQTEEALRESEEKYRTVSENSLTGIFIHQDERYVYVNDRFAEIHGYRPEELLGREFRALIHPDDREIAAQMRSERLAGKAIPHRYEIRRLKKDGQTIWCEMMVSCVEYIGKTAFMGNVVDITELKQAESELTEYRDKMARAEQLASLGTLSATIAHRLTSPITAIRLSIENSLADLETTSCPDTVTEDLKDGLSGISEAVSIVDSFRDFARKSSEKIVSQVSLKAVAERIVNLLNESARRAKVSLHLKGMDELPAIYSHEKDLEQLFFALIDNAIQAADGKKSHQLIIDGAVKDKQIELRFADNCSGIAPENLDKIFEPFFTTRPAGEGTGLGLCVVEHIVSRAGGKVRVASKAGEGSTFFVTLPINKGRRS